MKILFPTDLTVPLEAAIDQIAAILPLAEQNVHLLYVNEAWPAYENVLGLSGEFADDWRNKLEKEATAKLLEAEKLLQARGAVVSKEIVSGPPAMMIETVARDEHCQLTVMMPGKHPLVDQMLLGSVSGKVVKHGPGTILIDRPKNNYPKELKNVLIGIDGSANAKEAIMTAVDTFQLERRNPQILLFHAVDLADPIKFVSPVEFISRVEQNLLLEGETYLADAKKLLADLGLKKVEFAIKQGKPAHELVETAKAMPADLIIVGAEGRTAVQHFLLGSVSHRIAMQAPCAVAIVKREHRPS
ncbi:MAG: universal stress protein [Candidatus Obscuribacterales bacterium]|nr:universal stress protein [Candidatus Obscuribacterales bacterium]